MKLTTAVLIATLAAGAPFAAVAQNINHRKENQQDRIAQGVKSGQLTPHETARLEHQESSINRQETRMRSRDQGHLTRRDRKVLDRRQNKESHRVFRDKHNRRKS
jgi:uncharacterized protein HemX